MKDLAYDWNHGAPKGRLIYLWLTSIPIFTFPLGEQSYYKSVFKYGQESVLSPHNLWRSVLHVLGGFILTTPFWGSFRAGLISMAVIFLMSAIHEVFGDIKTSGFHAKNIVDILSWTLGSGIVVLLGSGGS